MSDNIYDYMTANEKFNVLCRMHNVSNDIVTITKLYLSIKDNECLKDVIGEYTVSDNYNGEQFGGYILYIDDLKLCIDSIDKKYHNLINIAKDTGIDDFHIPYGIIELTQVIK